MNLDKIDFLSNFRKVAVVCNAILFVFTCFVLVTDGVSSEITYLFLTLLLLLVPILSSIVLVRSRMTGQVHGTSDQLSVVSTLFDWVTVICNLVLIGFSCWAIVTQYPNHPKEGGAVAFAIMIVFTLIINLAILFGSMMRKMHKQQKVIAH